MHDSSEREVRAISMQVMSELFMVLSRKLGSPFSVEQAVTTLTRRMHQETGTTAVYVTHDQEEALTLSSRIAVMNKGRLEQYEPPEDVYDRPATQFVAEFTGNPQTNLIEAQVARDTADAGLKVAGRIIGRAMDCDLPSKVMLAARPEALMLCGEDGPGTIPATVYVILPVGSSVLVYARIGGFGPGAYEAVIRAGRGARVEANQKVWLQLDWSQVNMYEVNTGRRLDNAVRP